MLVKKPKPLVKRLAIDDLVIRRELQPRYYVLDKDHVQDLARILLKEAQGKVKRTKIFPPKVIVVPDVGPCVYDGHHTIEAAKVCKATKIKCEVVEGTWEEAVLLAARANSDTIGLKRSNADKRRAVELALGVLPKNVSAMEVANWVGDVSDQFVRNIKREMREEAQDDLRPEDEEVVAYASVSDGEAVPVAVPHVNGKPPKAPKEPKAGAVRIDKRRVEGPLGNLSREILAIGKNSGTDGTPEFHGLVRTMNELESGLKAWIARLNKGD